MKMHPEKFYGMVGLAIKAGKTVMGGAACDAGIKNGKVKLMLVDGEASQRTKKDFTSACAYYEVDIIVLDDTNDLEKRFGRKLVGITEAGFAKKAKELCGVCSGGEKLEQNKNTGNE